MSFSLFLLLTFTNEQTRVYIVELLGEKVVFGYEDKTLIYLENKLWWIITKSLIYFQHSPLSIHHCWITYCLVKNFIMEKSIRIKTMIREKEYSNVNSPSKRLHRSRRWCISIILVAHFDLVIIWQRLWKRDRLLLLCLSFVCFLLPR